MSSASKIIQAAAGNAAGEALYVEDVFSTYLYDGNGSTQTITNGIDLDGEGGLVTIKRRDSSGAMRFTDTERGIPNTLDSDSTAGQNTFSTITAFNSDGFDLRDIYNNASGATYASWTFRKAPKFFDVVTYTGDGTNNRAISHNLGGTVGFLVVKRLDQSSTWHCYHQAIGAQQGRLEETIEFRSSEYPNVFHSSGTEPTDSVFYVGGSNPNDINTLNATYVAYLFAHNNGDGEFGESGDQDIIKCGSFTTDSNGEADIDLGFEPQWLMIKSSSADDNDGWQIHDTMRGIVVGGDEARLSADSSGAEGSVNAINQLNATGWSAQEGSGNTTYIYIAIRRGPMKTPESGTEVFAMDTLGSTGDGEEPGYRSPFPVDMGLKTALTGNQRQISTRLLQGTELLVESTAAEAASASKQFDYMNGTDTSTATSSVNMMWMFGRAPGFFDVVAYTGTASSGNSFLPQNVSHNLSAVPEMMIVKCRSTGGSTTYRWHVYHKDIGNTKALFLNETSAETTGSAYWNNTTPTESVFRVGGGFGVNELDETYIAYLFATLPGVSKVGSYTGNGTSQTIDCGFSAGARFVMTKRVNTTGNWNVWDSERGIIAGNDPRLELNTTDAEDTGHDYIDPDSSGFIVNYVADDDDDSNVSGDEYIFLAIA